MNKKELQKCIDENISVWWQVYTLEKTEWYSVQPIKLHDKNKVYCQTPLGERIINTSRLWNRKLEFGNYTTTGGE